MTIESELLGILSKYGIHHLSAFLDDEGIRVRVYGKRTFDNRKYYQENRERVRKYQHEYYMRKRGKEYPYGNTTFKPNEDNNKMSDSLVDSAEAALERISGVCDDFSFFDSSEVSVPREAVREPISEEEEKISFNSFCQKTPLVVTHTQLAAAMANVYAEQGREANAEEFMEVAEGVMQFFGFYDEVVENHLEEGDRQIMYQLEDAGLISTRSEETSLVIDGQLWRTHYFVLNRERIMEAASRKPEAVDPISETYRNLPEEAWAR